MKIVEFRATPVTVPLKRPLLWAYGVEVSTTRTVIELLTDEGLVGIGETRGGDEIVRALELNRELFIGLDPLKVWEMVRRFSVFHVTSEQLGLVGAIKLAGAGLEMACWDLVGKALDMRCGDLWGGVRNESIEFTGYVFYRYNSLDAPVGKVTAESAAEYSLELVESGGFRDIKFKNGVLPPEDEIKAVRLMREWLGERMRYVRVDPNGAWSVETSVRTLNALDEFGLEFGEDPTSGIEGMSLVRERTHVPLATNMACVSFEQIPMVVRNRALDIILGDVHFWGGVGPVMQLAKVCETFGLGLSLHSDRELGISTAAVLHLASAETMISHAIDSHLLEQSDDIITTPFCFKDGRLKVPSGPGLGVDIDYGKLQYYADYHVEHGEQIEFKDSYASGFVAKWPRF